MLATHRIINSDAETVGFLIDNKFYTDYITEANIGYIRNLSISDNVIHETSAPLPCLNYKCAVNEQIYARLLRENPFVRDIQRELSEWRADRTNTVLQLEGTRQTGKTTELQKFAYKNYEYVIFVDLSDDMFDFRGAVEHGCTPLEMEKYCRRAALPHFVNNSGTILVIDEIQNSSKVYNSIRRMRSELDCDIIVTGSYLGRLAGNRDFFLPAGTISSCYMFPLSFKEFCRVFGCDGLLEKLDLYGNDSDENYGRLEKLYRLYVKIGGYPEVVKRYQETESIDSCYDVIRKLLNTFKEESRNYFQFAREVEIFEHVYREALKEMCNKKRGSGKNVVERLTVLTKEATDLIVSKSEVANAVIWLRYAGILGVCNLAHDGDMRNILPDRRVYFSDCGIASYLADNSLLDSSSLAGLLAETFVYNELHRLFRTPYADRKVIEEEVCFAIHGSYELDFMVADRAKVIYGIEVKSKDGAPLSLKVFLDKHLVEKGVVAKPARGGRGDKFDTIPVYAVGCRFPYQ